MIELFDTPDKDDRSTAERSATMKRMLKQMASTEHQAAMATAESAEQRRADAEKELARWKELLENAPTAGIVKNLEDAVAAVSSAENAWNDADQNIKALRGDYFGDVAPPAKNNTYATTPSPAPVETVGASNGVEPDKAGPLPLTTEDIAFCFAGLRWQTEAAWKKPLGDKPKWLQACIAIPGVRGVSQTRWNPVLIGAALKREEHATQNSIRARFQTKPQLAPWLDAWKTYEADNFDTE